LELPKAITITRSSAYSDGGSEDLIGTMDDGGQFQIHLHQWMFEDAYRGRLLFNRELVEFRSSDEARIVDLIRNASFESGDGSVDFRDWRRPEVIWKERCDRFVARILAPIPPLPGRQASNHGTGSIGVESKLQRSPNGSQLDVQSLNVRQEARVERIVLRLDPRLLANPDADIRYQLPDLLAERSAGAIVDNGYDYVGEPPLLVLFLNVIEVEPAMACILDVVENVRLLDNDLRKAVAVAVERAEGHEVVYPRGFTGSFLR